MSHPALSPRPVTRAALELSPRAAWLALAMAGCLAIAAIVPWAALALALLVTGLTFGALVLLVKGLSLGHARAEAQLRASLAELIAEDAAPGFLTDRDGAIFYANAAAKARFGAVTGAALRSALTDLSPAPASLLYRLQNRALAQGAAREDLNLRSGVARLSVHRAGQAGFVWRLDDLGRAEGRMGGEIALPMMIVTATGTILEMNEALRHLLGGREAALDRVIADLPLRSGEVHRVNAGQGAVAALAIEQPLSGGRREIYLLPEPARARIAPAEWGVVESLPVPLLRVDRAGRVIMANRRARGLLGVGAATGQHLSDLVEGLGRPVSDWLREAWDGRNLGRTETLRAIHAEERFLQVTLERYHDETGPALVAVLHDATELKSLETQFVQSQKMQAIGQLAGGVAHDFNNLLTAISGHCDLLLLRHADEADPDYADLHQVAQNANRAAALVGQLLAFSRKQTLRPQIFDIADTMGDLTHLLGRLVGEQVRIVYEAAPGVRPVRADKRQLEQVLMNLVVNARDAMAPGGGRIRLVLENRHLDAALERDRATVPPGDYVAIQVIDEGSGIAPEHLAKIFEPFFTTKGAGKGTGLGLSMVYGIVKQSGGFIFVDSVPGSGTTFTLYFPVFDEDIAPADAADPDIERQAPEPAAPVALPPQAPAAAQAEASGVVLLVEDEAPVRAFASRALRLRGHTVLEAATGEAALEILDDASLSVDIFVTDVIMRGLDGPTWVAEALRRRPGVRVVFVSGYAEDSVSEHQARIPNSVFLPKPFSLAELTAIVAKQLHETGREGAFAAPSAQEISYITDN
ncbi:ATP-binding protein [Sinisalibacter aestuarii]|uniref:histidine kinase n=1 Tax=Sinisalibacter aestuarii TaxID=2949426 RepID=A0ABQ5LZQ5_9RHOB|nr:ATP-binding protein [Sinisalibacter aestuarii]GKY89801.1 hybrid sensor histidine kinase/response regulator [Sinisalibacter aestuarii]